MILQDKIKAEVEKKTHGEQGYSSGYAECGYRDCARDILSFLNTLEVKEVEKETISEDLEYAALLHYPKMSRISEPHGFIPADNKSHYLGDANEDNRKAFIVGAQWQKEQDQSTIELTEDHAMLAGMEKMKHEIIDKAMVWLTSNMKWGVVSWDDKEECVRNFKKAMEE